MAYPRIASFKSHEDFTGRLKELGLDLPSDAEVQSGDDSPLGQTITLKSGKVGNRFCILPMEGWDGTSDGKPTELTRRRWVNFGISGAKLIWGGEAVAVRHDGRANPNQLMINDANLSSIESLRTELVGAHQERFDRTDDLLVGLQLTHSGRFARPNQKTLAEPRTAQRNPALDPRFGISDDSKMLSDDELKKLIDDFVAAAVLAKKAGYAFVDIKHCHGYLGHELLSGFDRPGQFGGSFENRTRFARDIIAGIRAEAPGLEMGVRVSVFDFVPYRPSDEDRIGIPDEKADPRLTFGGDGSGLGIDLSEPSLFMTLLEELGIELVCSTAGSPYYNPHIQRPAYFPPSDGYQPPEDPLVGVTRQILATAELTRLHPNLTIVGSGYTYLQDWLPNVAQAVVRTGMVDSVGLGRMVLSYPDLPADVLSGKTLVRKKVCRTFSDCTTAPRNGIVSGCYPLDPFYKDMPERKELAEAKKG
ncbi:oxidoreductase [Novipirellula artificiosorum]|uniref:NADPH dehydrogenase n=1 Tax=Novipirellula artificiosorum TaxID=2528016 RepID=A0A5C6D7W2_9BACT|nr:NADH:flavin oxidoreductase [Novipirellula artificiosorum]TWU33022.1 NADPH dehydrogenase [Novipirellula artificiosorum]